MGDAPSTCNPQKRDVCATGCRDLFPSRSRSEQLLYEKGFDEA
jgi:hypothetical protein